MAINVILAALLQAVAPEAEVPQGQVSIIVALPTDQILVGSEQDIHPDDTTSIYVGGMYEVHLSQVRLFGGADVRKRLQRERASLLATDLLIKPRPMLLVLGLTSGALVVRWWDWADRDLCIGAGEVVRDRLDRFLPNARKMDDGSLCLGGSRRIFPR
jgi:hypothetical protein